MNTILQTKMETAQSPSITPTHTRLLQLNYVGDECVPSEVPAIVHEVLRSPGRPLDPSTRAFMEPRFGHDFSKVRVHMDSKAAESAQAVDSLAFTVGRDVVFRSGQYQPGTGTGQRLLAHELVHVLQQSSAQPALSLRLKSEQDTSEREADMFAGAVLNTPIAQSRLGGFSVSLHRIGPDQAVQRVSFGKDGELSPDLKAIVQAASEIVERRIMVRDFEQQWGGNNDTRLQGYLHAQVCDSPRRGFGCQPASP